MKCIAEDRETWIHTEDYGLVMKTHWTCQKDMWLRPIAKKQPFKCPKCRAGKVHSLALCQMDTKAASPYGTIWIYKCKECGYQFSDRFDFKSASYILEGENHHNTGDLGW